MALSDQWSNNQIRAVVQRELLDPKGQWWPNTELDQYINDWQDILQTQYEFVWSTATITFTDTTTTFNISAFAPDAMRLDGVWYCAGTNTASATDTSTGRLSPRSPADLDSMYRNWRGTQAASGIPPSIVYQNNAQTVSFWPPPNGTGTVYFEYPTTCTFSAGTSTMLIPAWTRYSAVSYCLYRAYARFGPNQDLNKAKRRRMQWEKQMRWIRKTYDAYFPDKAEMLRPGRKWAGQVLRTHPAWPVYSANIGNGG